MASLRAPALVRHLNPVADFLCRYAHSPRRTYIDARRIASTTAKPVDRLAEFTRDEEIGSRQITIKRSDGKLEPPKDLFDVLRSIDRSTHTIVRLSKPGEGTPIVQIYEKMELLKRVREKENTIRQQKLALKEKKPKQIEVNWAIGENDLQMKLRQLSSFLDDGRTVEVLLASKKRQRRATQEEAQLVLRQIREKIVELDAKETKAMVGQVLKQVVMTIKK